MLWYIEGSKIYLYYVINHEFATDFLVDKYFSTFTKLCFFKAKSPKLFGHFFNPYISMNLDDFELCVGPFAFDYVVYPIHETMCFKPTSHVLCANPCSSNFVVDPNHKKLCFISIYDFFCPFSFVVGTYAYDSSFPSNYDAMIFRFKVGEGTNLEFPIREFILKCQFLAIDDKEMKNVNKGVEESVSMLSSR